MKTRIALTDANPEKRMEVIYNQFDKLGISSNPTLFRVSELYMSSTQNNRIGIVCDDVTEYKLRVNIGPGKYDYITLTNYVKEKSPWNIDINKNLIILPGQALTKVFYSDMAIYYAQQGYSTYILDRRETNIPINETDFSYMENWTIKEHMSDTYDGVAISRIHTAILRNG